jgi:hypothetical protein
MSIFTMRWMQTAGTTAPSTDWWIERRSEELAMLSAILATKQPALRSPPARTKGTKRRNRRAQRERIFARPRYRRHVQRRTARLRRGVARITRGKAVASVRALTAQGMERHRPSARASLPPQKKRQSSNGEPYITTAPGGAARKACPAARPDLFGS